MERKNTYNVTNIPQNLRKLAYTNALYMNNPDFEMYKTSNRAKNKVYVKIKGNVFELKPITDINKGEIAMGRFQREMLLVSQNGSVELECI